MHTYNRYIIQPTATPKAPGAPDIWYSVISGFDILHSTFLEFLPRLNWHFFWSTDQHHTHETKGEREYDDKSTFFLDLLSLLSLTHIHCRTSTLTSLISHLRGFKVASSPKKDIHTDTSCLSYTLQDAPQYMGSHEINREGTRRNVKKYREAGGGTTEWQFFDHTKSIRELTRRPDMVACAGCAKLSDLCATHNIRK